MMIKVYPRPNETIQQTMRRLKKLCEREGIMKEIKKHTFYEKPSEARKRQQRRSRKKTQEQKELSS
jgi:small subunit ribosomal protein S21